jgi:hypothetical protein
MEVITFAFLPFAVGFIIFLLNAADNYEEKYETEDGRRTLYPITKGLHPDKAYGYIRALLSFIAYEIGLIAQLGVPHF